MMHLQRFDLYRKQTKRDRTHVVRQGEKMIAGMDDIQTGQPQVLERAPHR